MALRQGNVSLMCPEWDTSTQIDAFTARYVGKPTQGTSTQTDAFTADSVGKPTLDHTLETSTQTDAFAADGVGKLTLDTSTQTDAFAADGVGEPSLDPIQLVAVLRQAHQGRRDDPDGLRWPWTTHDTVNRMRSLDEHRQSHRVTKEIVKASRGLTNCQKILLSLSVRHTQSCRGAAHKFRQAVLDGTQSVYKEAVMAPMKFPTGAPYRNVLSREEVFSQAPALAKQVQAKVPFDSIQAARDFMKDKMVAHGPENQPDATRESSFHSAEVAKDLLLWGMVKDKRTCPLEVRVEGSEVC